MGPTEAVMKYLRDQNRPYSVNDIIQNLHNEFGRAAVLKAVDELVEKQQVLEKVYGKQKVYSIKQDIELKNSTDMNEELQNLDMAINEVSKEVESTEQDLRVQESRLKDMLLESTMDEAVCEQSELEAKVARLQEKLGYLREKSVKISPEEKQDVQKAYDFCTKEWRKRKNLCMDIVNSILESYPKDKKTLFEEIGIETDESVVVCFSK